MCDTYYVCVANDDDFVRLCSKYVGGTARNSNLQRQLVKIIIGRAKAEEGATAKAEEGAARATAKAEEGAARATAPAKPEEGGPQPEDVSDEDEVKLVPQLILLKDVITSIWKAGGEKFPYDDYTSRYTPYEYPAYTLPTPSIYPLYALTSPRVHPPSLTP